jgi:hypothetical protein
MPIAMTDGTTYENELDKLFGDMDRAQQAQKRPGLGELEHKEKMADFESVAPPTDAHPTEMLGAYDASTKEENQLQPQMQADHNNPQNWGWKQIERQMNELIGETPGGYAQEGRDAVEFGITRGERTEQKVQATPEGKSTYEDLKGFYEGAPPDLVHPKAYENLQQVTPEQRKSLLWDTPIMSSKDPSMHEGDMESRFNHIDEALRESQDSMDQRWEQGKKDWNDLAAKDKRFKPTDPNEPGGPAGRVRMRFTPAARDYLENLPITREDGSTFIGYDKKKLNQLERMWMNGNTYQEIADELNTSRGSVASMAKQMGLKRWDPRGENRTGKGTKDAEFSPEDLARGAAEGSEAGKPWSPAEDKVLKAWYADPNGDLAEIPNMLKHRSEQSIFNRARQKGYDQAQLPDESAKPFVPKGAVRAPEKGSGSGPVNTELEGKTGIRTPSGLNDPEFRSLQAMRKAPDNQNISPQTFGENLVRQTLAEEFRANQTSLSAAQVNTLVNKHGPEFEQFYQANPNIRGTSASEFSKYMKKQDALISELRALERSAMDPYDKAVQDRKKRKDNIKPVK